MPGDNKELLIKVRADIKQAKREMESVRKEIARIGTSSKKTSGHVRSMSYSMSNSMMMIQNAMMAMMAVAGVAYIINMGDAYDVLQTRIKSATKATGDYNRVSAELYRLSQANGVQLKDTVDVFQKLTFSAKALGATNSQILKVTDTVQKLGVIGGSTQGQMSAGLLQFTQALSSGVVRAEETNSIIENLPLLATRLEKTLGLLPGQLKNAVNQGKILSKDVFGALLKMAPDVSKEFSGIPKSIGRAATEAYNSLSKMLSALGRSTGMTRGLVASFEAMSSAMSHYADRVEKANSPEFKLNLELTTLKRRLEDRKSDSGALNRWLFGSTDDINKRIRSIVAELAKIKASTKTLGNKGPGTPAIPSSPAADRLIERLKLQASSFGQTKDQIALYRVEVAKANPAQMALAKSLIKTVSADNAFAAAVNASEQAVKDENETYQKWVKSLKEEGQQAVEAAKTAQERYNDQIARYKYLLDQGALSQAEYTKVIGKAKKDFEDLSDSGGKAFKSLSTSGDRAMRKLEAATRGWGREFTNTLADMVQTGKLNFKNLADAIIKDLLRIMIYQKITQPLFHGLDVKGFVDGGVVTGPGTSTSDSIPARLSAGEYVVNARAVREYGTGFMESINRMILPRFANVPGIPVSRPGTHFADGGLVSPVNNKNNSNVKVELINKGRQPVAASDAEVSFDATGMVVRVILDDIDRNGRISNTFQRTFNLRRGGG